MWLTENKGGRDTHSASQAHWMCTGGPRGMQKPMALRPMWHTDLALSPTQLVTAHQLITLYIEISVHITGVATVSCLDPDWHSVSVLQGPFSVYGMEGILTREIKGMHMLHTPGHPLEMHSPAGLSKCYTSRDQPQGRAKVGSAGSSQKPFFLQPVTNQNMCNRV